MALRIIKASEVKDFTFCPRSWAYHRRGIELPPEAVQETAERFERGREFHQEHGEAVCQAGRQIQTGALLAKVGLAILVLGVLLWKFLLS